MAGYSGTPLVKKLGLTEGLVIFICDAPETYFDSISPLPKGLVVKDKLVGEFDFIHLFANQLKRFQKEFISGKKHLKKQECFGFPGLRSHLKFQPTWMKISSGISACRK